MTARSFTCEVCGVSLRFHGGPHTPRWCAEHRQRHAPAADPAPVHCQRCHTRMLTPHETGQCGFCIEELQVLEAA